MAAERKTLSEHPQETTNQIVMELLRRNIDLLDRLGRGDEAADVMQQMVLSERGDSASLTELIEWFVKRKAWKAIDETAARFAASFELDAMLMYTLCEARLAQGNRELAEQTAERALKLSGDNPQEHAAVVDRLVERGLVEWADRELRQIIALGPTGSATDIRARRFLSDSLHDRRRDLEAAEVIRTLMDAADKDPVVMQRVRASRQQSDVTVNLLRSSMYYYLACDAQSHDDVPKQREFLDKALEQDRTNVDVLIALYRATDKEPEKRAQLTKLLKDVIDTCRAQIEKRTGRTHVLQPGGLADCQYRGGRGRGDSTFAEVGRVGSSRRRVAQARGRFARHAGPLLLCQKRLRQCGEVPDRGGSARSEHRGHRPTVEGVSRGAGCPAQHKLPEFFGIRFEFDATERVYSIRIPR